MNRTATILFFTLLYLITTGIYVFIYYKKKKKVAAITVSSIIAILISTGIPFVIPFAENRKIQEDITCGMKIEERTSGPYAVCEDGTEYEIKSMNSKMTSGYNSYANDKSHENVKSIIKYRNDYRIWWLIPAYSTGKEINIYFDNEWFSDKYGCKLPQNASNIK